MNRKRLEAIKGLRRAGVYALLKQDECDAMVEQIERADAALRAFFLWQKRDLSVIGPDYERESLLIDTIWLARAALLEDDHD